MSRVFVATETALGRKVVVKVLPPEMAAGVNVDRFRREIQLAASLQHPHIVPLLAAGSSAELLYFTMPFIEGESLRATLTRDGELPINAAVRILRDVADALAYAHQRGVVHRDIKPDNVLLSGHHALVTDFGVAKALESSTGESSLTSVGVALGTPAYMSPEQAAAEPHIDHRADIYAFGCLAYELLTGRPPFAGMTAQQVLAAHVTQRVEPVTTRRPTCPPALDALIMHCLEKQPSDRWQSAGELHEQLELIATPSGGTVPTSALRADSPMKRPWRNVAAASLLFLAGMTGFALWHRSGATSSLDANLVAIAPFDVIGSELGVWREGFVDLLSRNLDGAGPLKTVSPTVVIRRWSGRADPASASGLGRNTGAGLVVFGSLVGAGRDSVRLDAAILDAQSGKQVGEVQLRGDSRRMDEVADSLTLSLLRELGRSRPIGAVRLAGLTSTPAPALKAFLQGEQFYRRGTYDSAQVRYEAAIAVDSLLVPALRHLSYALSWSPTPSAAGTAYLARAVSHNHGLAPRDSLLVAADSMFVALQTQGGLPDSLSHRFKRRYVETLEAAIARYPADPEIWYALGEARVHEGWEVGATETQMQEAFDHAIALDSSFVPAYEHQVGLGLWSGGLAGWDRYARPYLAIASPEDKVQGSRLLDALLHTNPADTVKLDSILSRGTYDELFHSFVRLSRVPDSAELGIRVARAVGAARTPGAKASDAVRRDVLASALAARGHVRQIYSEHLDESGFGTFPMLPGDLALLGGALAESTEVRFGRWVRDEPYTPRLLLIGAGCAAQGDTLLLRLIAVRLDSVTRTSKSGFERDAARYSAAAARSYLVLARGDTASALAGLAALPADNIVNLPDKLVESRLLASRGRDREALAILDRELPYWWDTPLRELWSLEHARVSERIGQRSVAIKEYQFVADMWRHADPELQPYVTEAKAALARLTKEPRP